MKGYKALSHNAVRKITLLNIEEYRAIQKHIPPLDEWWWLRSPGCSGDRAAYVGPGGGVHVHGTYVIYDIAVRPALRLDAWSVNLQIGDKFRFGGKTWTYIAEGLALSDEAFCRMPFREDWKAEDANVYEASDIKASLDKWLEDHTEGQAGETAGEGNKKPLFCIIGRTGSGKSTFARILEKEFGKKQVRSYTTRPMRPGEEKQTDHIFIREDEVKDYIGNTAVYAYTKIGPYEYFTTHQVLEASDTYVIDPIGVADIRKRVKDRPIFEVYVAAGKGVLKERLANRQDGNGVVEKRRNAESAQFDAYELLKPWDFLVENDGSVEDLKQKAARIIKEADHILGRDQGAPDLKKV